MASTDLQSGAANGNAFVYVIGPDTGPFKVGRSSAPYRRLDYLQGASPLRLRLHHQERMTPRQSILVEREAHRRLAPHRRHGEWFDADLGAVVEAVSRAAEAVDSQPITEITSRPHRGGSDQRQLLHGERFTDWQAAAGRWYVRLFRQAADEAERVQTGRLAIDSADAIERLAKVHGLVRARLDGTDVALLVHVVGQGVALSRFGKGKFKQRLRGRLARTLDVVGEVARG